MTYYGRRQKALIKAKERQTEAVIYQDGKEELRALVMEGAQNTAKEIVAMMQAGTPKAVGKIYELLDSENENVSGQNARWWIDHHLGKATQKSISRVERVNIDILAQ